MARKIMKRRKSSYRRKSILSYVRKRRSGYARLPRTTMKKAVENKIISGTAVIEAKNAS
jgi:hypothetical protein